MDAELREIKEAQMRILQVLDKMESEDPDRAPTTGEKLADTVVTFVGSWKFIIIQSIFLLIYITFNALWITQTIQFDPYPFILLNLLLSFQAAFTAPLILISSNRSERKDRRRAIDGYRTVLNIEDMLKTIHQKIERKKNGVAKEEE